MRLNRKNDELRPVNFELNYTKHAAGSVLISHGDTKVICTATIENKLPSHRVASGLGWLTAEYSMLPSSTHQRNKRSSGTHVNARALEIQRLIGRALRSCVDFELLGPRQIIIDCDVIQADGGTRVASINGGFVALSMAVNKLLADGVIATNPIKFSIGAISVGIVNQDILLDLDYNEDSSCDSDVNIVLNDNNDIIEIQGSAEGSVISQTQMSSMMQVASIGISQVISLQNKAL